MADLSTPFDSKTELFAKKSIDTEIRADDTSIRELHYQKATLPPKKEQFRPLNTITDEMIDQVTKALAAAKAEEAKAAKKNNPAENKGVVEETLTQIKNLGQGLFHGTVELGYNGASQLLNKTAGTKFPELKLTDDKVTSETTLGQGGSLVGQGLTVLALSKLTGVFGARTGTEAMLKSGATAGLYGGVFQPTNINSESFYLDRIQNAGVAAFTGGVTGRYIHSINAGGLFARSEVRSLTGHLGFFGSTGGVAGLAYSEGNALIKKQELLPTAEEAFHDFTTGIITGIALGGIAYTGNRILPRQVTNIDTGDSKLKVTSTANGEALKLELRTDVPSHEWNMTNFKAVKLTDGTWSGTARNSSTLFSSATPNELISNVVNTPTGPRITFTQYVQNGHMNDSVGRVSRTFAAGENNTQFWGELRSRSAVQQAIPILKQLLLFRIFSG